MEAPTSCLGFMYDLILSTCEGRGSKGLGNNDDVDNDAAELLAAAERGRACEVSRILAKDPDLMFIGDSIGDTVLHVAARAGQSRTISKVLGIAEKHGQLVRVMNEGNIDGDTALHLAFKDGHKKAIESLLKPHLGARERNRLICLKNNDGVSPWSLAQESGSKALKWLVRPFGEPQFLVVDFEQRLAEKALSELDGEEEEPEVNEDWSCLRKAAKKGLEDVVECILAKDPNLVRHVDGSEGTALHIAARARQVGTLRQLVQFIMTTFESTKLMLEIDGLGDTALHTALKSGLNTATHYLVEAAPQAVYQLNEEGASPLYLAVVMGHVDLVRHMITQAAMSRTMEQSLVSHAKETCLPHAAIKAKNLGMLQAILEILPYLINASDVRGWKPLSYAANQGHLDQVSYLLTNFPDSIDKRDRDGSFPIHKAVAGGQICIVKELIERFPHTLDDVDMKGRTIIHIAARYARGNVLSFLLEQDIVKILDIKDNDGKTCMKLANQIKNGTTCATV